MRRASLVLLACLGGPRIASAQVGVGVGVGPDALPYGGRERAIQPPEPLGLAVSLVFDTGTWLAVAVSTSAPAAELEGLARKGFYKLELVQLTMLAKASGKTLAGLAARREKGDGLRKIAEDLKLDYDSIYDQSLPLSQRVDERLGTLTAVRAFAKPEERP